MPVTHQFSNTLADWTGTVTVYNNAGATTTVAASALVNPGNWNQAHSEVYSLTGNTNNSAVVGGTNIVFSGGANITLVGSTAAGQATIGISGYDPAMSWFDNQIPGAVVTADLSSGQSLFVFPLTPANELFPADMTLQTLMFDMSNTITSAAFSRTLIVGFYTSVNSTQLSRLYSGSVTFGQTANANMSSSYSGIRWLTVHSSLFTTSPVFVANSRYWVALAWRTSGVVQSLAFIGQPLGHSSQRSGFMGINSVTNASLGQARFQGWHSVSTTGLPAALAQSDLSHIGIGATFLPRMIFNNVGTNVG
jgi:hypothetical protein